MIILFKLYYHQRNFRYPVATTDLYMDIIHTYIRERRRRHKLAQTFVS